MKHQQQEKGIIHLGIVLAVVLVLAALALGGWWVWERNRNYETDSGSNSTSQSSNDQSDNEKESNVLSLANGAVLLTLPDEWPYIKGSPDYCYINVTSDITSCEESAIITPGVERATQAGGPDYFGIGVSVYENPRQSIARTWIEQDLNEGSASNTDVTSTASINGYDTYYWKKMYSGDGTSFEELYYVFLARDKAVLIHARIYAPRTLDDGTQVGDFREFEPAIAEMANSIKIN